MHQIMGSGRVEYLATANSKRGKTNSKRGKINTGSHQAEPNQNDSIHPTQTSNLHPRVFGKKGKFNTTSRRAEPNTNDSI